MARKAHQADHRKGEDVIEYKGEGREDVRPGEEVEHAEDDGAHQDQYDVESVLLEEGAVEDSSSC